MLRSAPVLGLLAVAILLAVIIWLVWTRGQDFGSISSLVTAAFWILVGVVPLLVRKAKEEQRRRREEERAGRNYDIIQPK